MDQEEIGALIVDCGLRVHRTLGPGLLESAYETVLAHLLEQNGLRVQRQIMVPITFESMVIDQGFRADILVEGKVLIELKSVERLMPVHHRQVLTYLRFMGLSLGYLLNFSTDRFTDGVKRIVNGHRDTASSRLRIHQ